jgi:hypothetical protein
MEKQKETEQTLETPVGGAISDKTPPPVLAEVDDDDDDNFVRKDGWAIYGVII